MNATINKVNSFAIFFDEIKMVFLRIINVLPLSIKSNAHWIKLPGVSNSDYQNLIGGNRMKFASIDNFG
jgi:hypothetical protein